MNIIKEIEKILLNQFPECDKLTANLVANQIIDKVDESEKEV